MMAVSLLSLGFLSRISSTIVPFCTALYRDAEVQIDHLVANDSAVADRNPNDGVVRAGHVDVAATVEVRVRTARRVAEDREPPLRPRDLAHLVTAARDDDGVYDSRRRSGNVDHQQGRRVAPK
jgi:hypothetical protein